MGPVGAFVGQAVKALFKVRGSRLRYLTAVGGRRRSAKVWGAFGAFALVATSMAWLSMPMPASAQTTFSNTSSISLANPTSSAAQEAGTYPSPITVSGLTGTISNITVALSGINYSFSQDLGVLLVGPSGSALSLFTAVGSNTQSTASNNLNVTLSDTGTAIAYNDTTFPTSGSLTMKPADFSDHFAGFSYDSYPSPAPSTFSKAADEGSATLAPTFDGTNPDGTWDLYVTTNASGDGTGTISGGWSVDITTATTLSSTTTSLHSNQNPSFTSSPNNSVGLTAMVSSSGSPVTAGTVDFTDGGTTISGCGAAALDSGGSATCNTSFSTEGDHDLAAVYSGTSSFVTSTGTLTQVVNDHTTVSGNTFSNTGTISVPNAVATPGEAVPYPSDIFVSGLTGSISNVTATLSGITYPFSQDLNVLLVGPQGGSEILLSNVGPSTGTTSATNTTLTFDDSTSFTLPENSTFPSNSTVVTKPVDYTGNDTFPSPAPAGPYGTPAPRGTSTLGEEFNGSNPNGTWSLYVVTDGAGDGAGQISGGWSLTFTLGSEALTSTSVSGNPNPSFTSPPDQSVTFTATVTSGSPAAPVTSGTVDFTADGTTISGCGAAALNSNGQATCTTTYSSEADLTIQAIYSGTTSFAESTGSATQEVDNHTTVVAPNEFANSGAITLNNPTTASPEQATPYPSHIYVSNLGPVTGLTVKLDGISYPFSQDLDFLLVGPQGQSIVLLSNVGPSTGTTNASNVTVTFNDTAGQILATTPLGSPNSSVTTKPVDYTGSDTDTFPAPAPTGPYGTPAPKGSATLGGTFDGTNPGGVWSLYAVTVGEGDGTGTISGGWSIDFAVANQTVSFTTTAPTTADAGTNYAANATATSTLPVAYSIDAGSTPGTCSVDATSGEVSFLAAGTCILDANQSGDGNYNPAPQVQQTINVVSAPGAPTLNSATPGNGEVVLHWTAPASNGGSAITSYNIYEGTSSGGETLLENTGSATNSTTVVGLTNGTTYYFKVSAVNGIGEGPFPTRRRPPPPPSPAPPPGLRL